MNVYLDNAATTPLSQDMKYYLCSMLDIYENPSNVYEGGLQARRIINESRHDVAQFLNADDNEIIFTSSGSASNTLGIVGYINQCGKDVTLYYSSIAHKSIQECAKDNNGVAIPVDKDGLIDIDWLEMNLKTDKNHKLVVVDYANSEIGTIQDVYKIMHIVHDNNGVCLLDCTGSISSIQIDVEKLNVDMVVFSAHKLGALKGCGVLYKKKGIQLKPLVYGSQEYGLFGGTENLLGIASLGKAIRDYQYGGNAKANRDYVYKYIQNNIPDSYLIGSTDRLCNNLYMCFNGVSGETLMILLDMNGIQVSTGSACSSGDKTDSPTLLAIGMSGKDIRSCIRMCFSGDETLEELDYVCNQLKQNISVLRLLSW